MNIPDQLALFELQASVPGKVELAQSIHAARSIQAAWSADRILATKSTSSSLSIQGPGLRFAFYGRVSTAEYQDPESSMGWQRDSALDLIGSVGRIVVEYFDVGCSRRLPWTDRPQARRLLEALTRPDRVFDAIVVGEAERPSAPDSSRRWPPSSSSTECRCGCQNWTGPWIRRTPFGRPWSGPVEAAAATRRGPPIIGEGAVVDRALARRGGER